MPPLKPTRARIENEALGRTRYTAILEVPQNATDKGLVVVSLAVFFAIALGASSILAAVPSAAAAADPPSPTLWFGALVGLVLGMRHALEPDHLVAISTMVTEERGALRAARLGMSWGLGHTLTLVMAGTILALVRVGMPDPMADGFEVVVALMLIGLGLRALRNAWRTGSTGPDTIHAHGTLIHRHAGSADHLHVGSWVISRRPLIVGMVHGLAGSGALAALVMASLPSISSQIAYIIVFGLGSTVGMAALSGCVGIPLSRISRRPATLAWISAVAGALSIVAGFLWGGPLIWKWL